MTIIVYDGYDAESGKYFAAFDSPRLRQIPSSLSLTFCPEFLTTYGFAWRLLEESPWILPKGAGPGL